MVINYLISITGLDVRENADGSIDLIAADGTVRAATTDEMTAAKRLQLRDDINAERERREALGMLYQFPDGTSGTVQMRNATDFRNIVGLATVATILTMQGIATTILHFTDAENVAHPMMPSEVIAMGLAVQQRISALYAAVGGIKLALATADPDTFDATLGWPD